MHFFDVLGLKHVTSKFIPKSLNFEQKLSRVEVTQEFLNEVTVIQNCLMNVIVMVTTFFWYCTCPHFTNVSPASCDHLRLFLFTKLKSILKVYRFMSIGEPEGSSLTQLEAIPNTAFHGCFKDCWPKNVVSNWNYFEGSSIHVDKSIGIFQEKRK